jgi:membrane-bound lytic murein transglycosylase C
MKKLIALTVTAVLLFGACTGSQEKSEPVVEKKEAVNPMAGYPAWVIDPSIEDGYGAVGSSKIGAAGMSFARTEAIATGRDELARQLSVKVQNMFKSYTNSIGLGGKDGIEKVATNVSKQITNQTLKGTKVNNLWISPDKELFVQVIISTENIIESTKKIVTESVTETIENKVLAEEIDNSYSEEKLDEAIKKEVVSEDNFAAYKANQLAEADKFSEELEKSFANYKKVLDEEFNKFKQELAGTWKEPEVSSNTKWIEYSDSLDQRSTVDFEKQTIELEVIVDEDTDTKEVASKLKKGLFAVLMKDTETAYKDDQLSQNVDKAMKKADPEYKVEKVEKKPILTDLFVGAKDIFTKKDQLKVATLVKNTVDKIKPKERKAKQNGKKVVSISVDMPSDSLIKKAKQLKPTVNKYSNSEDIDPALVYAIIQSESSFNPMAKSYIPAYGLMQIVPKSAGKDATAKVHGKSRLLSSSELYNSKKNIRYGTAYLNILYYRYLKAIKNPESRYYCTVAAYNTGAGNIAKAFIGTTNISKAAVEINKLSPDQVYNTLLKKLPYDETKNYLKKVHTRKLSYEAAIQSGDL